MKVRIHQIMIFSIMLLTLTGNLKAGKYADIIVDRNGRGDYQTITEAVDALPMYPYRRTVIYVMNGLYNEKVRINQNYITIRGESRDSTIISYNQPREDWIASKDYIGPAVLNIYGDDFILENITVENSQPETGIHAFTVYGLSNRIVTVNCRLISRGGDTVSLWNYKTGMYYHSNCIFHGSVDLICPRGWCFVRDSQIYQYRKTAILWHDGHYDPDQKFVIVNSRFDGVPGFQLGRHHYEAQFYLLNCRFSENMADQPIYHVLYDDPARNNPCFEGDRKYFFQCRKEGESFDWISNNLEQAKQSPSPDQITPSWTFNGQWDPESVEPVRVIDYQMDGDRLILTFSDIVTVRGQPVFQNSRGTVFRTVMRRFNDKNRLEFLSESGIDKIDLTGEMTLLSGNIIASEAGVYERSLGTVFYIFQETAG